VVDLWVRPAETGNGRGDPERAGRWNARSQADLAAVLGQYRRPLPEFQRGPHGKPFLPGGPEFNLSHSAGGSAVAVAIDPVGVDIEGLGRTADWPGIARRYFFSHETAMLEGLPADGARAAFLEFWTAKEALCKLAGEGIYGALREASVEGAGGRFCGRPARLVRFGGAHGLAGTLATWGAVRVNIFEIGGISDREAGCHSKT